MRTALSCPKPRMVHRRPHSVLHDMHLCCSRARHRVFSLVEAMYDHEQMRALADQMQAALMLRADGRLDSLEMALPTTQHYPLVQYTTTNYRQATYTL